MKSRRNRVQNWLLLAAMLPAVAQAQFTFTNIGGAVIITGYTGSGGVATIPGTINGQPVASIGAGAFSNCTSLNIATIPNSVISLGSGAFSGCTNLVSVFFGADSPGADSTVFQGDDNALVYYPTGTMGWTSTYGGIATVPVPYLCTFTNSAIIITNYIGSGGAVNIPGTIGRLPVVSIGPSAFANNTSLNSVTIPDSVTSIGNYVFLNCSGLTNLVIGNGVTSIGTSAFQSCTSLTNVVIGNGVTSIGTYAFQYCTGLTNLVIGSGVTSIGSSAFQSCLNLAGMYFQGNAPGESSAFSGDYYAFVYYLPGTAGWNQTFDGITTRLWNLPSPFSYVTNNGAITITGYTGSNGIVTIPGAIYSSVPTNYLLVTTIGANAFANCPNLVSVIFPNSITNFGSQAFSGCTNLLGAFFGTNAPSADATVFSDDDNARAYYLPGTTGWGQTFGGIQTVLAPYNYTVNSSGLTIKGYTGPGGAVFIPDTIGGLPVINIGPAAFAFNGLLTSVTIPDTVTNIGVYAFWSCTNLATATLGTNVTCIEASALDSCSSLTRVMIPNRVTKVGGSAFQYCTSLTNLTIGSGVASIGNGAFDACASLSRIMVDSQNMNFGSVDGALVNKSRNALVQCPGGMAGIFTIPNTVTNIGSFAFDSSAGLTNITIPASVPGIGEWAFASCFGLTSLTIPNTVTSLGDYAFESCTGLKSVIIPDTVTTIGYSTFESCIALKSFSLPDNVTHIGYHAFDGCTSLTDITIGSGLTSFGNSIWLAKNFSDCPNLTSIYLRGNAPHFVWNPTNQTDHPTAYYLPGASWYSISGLPTALWLPRIQNSDASFGFQANQFGFNINWASYKYYVEVDACTNLAQAAWSPLATIYITNGSSYFSDPQWTNYPSRFYRVIGLSQ